MTRQYRVYPAFTITLVKDQNINFGKAFTAGSSSAGGRSPKLHHDSIVYFMLRNIQIHFQTFILNPKSIHVIHLLKKTGLFPNKRGHTANKAHTLSPRDATLECKDNIELALLLSADTLLGFMMLSVVILDKGKDVLDLRTKKSTRNVKLKVSQLHDA